MRSLRFVFAVVVLCLAAVFVGGGQVSAQTDPANPNYFFEQRFQQTFGSGTDRQALAPFLIDTEPGNFNQIFSYTNRALLGDGTVVELSSYNVPYRRMKLQQRSGYTSGFNTARTSRELTVPRGFSSTELLSEAVGGNQNRFISWNCDPGVDSGSATFSRDGNPAVEANDAIVEVNTSFLPYARQLTETNDLDGNGSIDPDDEMRIVCVAPEALENSTQFSPEQELPTTAYVPKDGWAVEQDSIDNPLYITPADGATLIFTSQLFERPPGNTGSAASDYTEPASALFTANFVYNAGARKNSNGGSAISSTCTGARVSATDSSTDFCVTSAQFPVEPVIADGDLPTFSSQAGAAASLINCGFAINNQCRDISSNAEATNARTLATNTVHDFVLKPRSDTTLKQVELALGVPYVGAPPNRADSTITVELTRDYTARSGYTVGDVTATGTSTRAIDANDVELSLQPCSTTSTETCLQITLNNVYVTAALTNPIYAITVTNTSNQQNTIYTR